MVDGLIAHEASSIVPNAVLGTKDEVEDIGKTSQTIDGKVTERTNVPERDKESNETWTKTGTRPVHQSIDYSKIVPLLIKTIQELEARITVLEG